MAGKNMKNNECIFFCQLLESKRVVSHPQSMWKKKESQIIIMSSFCSNCFHFRFSEAGFGEKIDQISHNGAIKDVLDALCLRS
jgi:hypothetical protein